MHILKVRFKTAAEFFDAYSQEVANGGLFCPTTTLLKPGDDVIVEMNVTGLPNKVLIRGIVRWWRPALPRLRVRAGALVEFAPEEKEKRDFVIQTLEGTRRTAQRRRHTRIPVSVPARYRLASSAEYHPTELKEISIGGAVVRIEEQLPVGTDIILEVTPPGGVAPMPIAGRVTHQTQGGSSGVRFLYRDGGGARRIRELLRRLKQA